MSRLVLELLGPFHATLDGDTLAFATDKARALLAYLALEPGSPHTRHSLAGLLWAEMPDTAALSNLRKTLHRLGQSLANAGPVLAIDRQSVQLRRPPPEVDVLAFERLLAECDGHPHADLHACGECFARLRQAADLYRGDLLAGLYLPDAVAFEEWLLVRREALRQQALLVLHNLAEAALVRGDHAQARTWASRQLALEPWREAAYRQLMRALSNVGERTEALAQYEACRRVLAEELGVEPSAETTALYEQVRAGRMLAAPPPASRTAPPRPAHLPPQWTSFVGREDELSALSAQLNDPARRLITLVGPGGCGKTRLAIRAAELAAAGPDYADGVFFVTLEAATTPELLVATVAGSLDLVLQEGDARVQLFAHLQNKRALLVLDSYEHLLAAVPEAAQALVTELLEAAPGVRLLVTSREALNLRAEWRLPLAGLEYPAADLPPEAPALYGAVELFVRAAAQIRPGFSPAGAQAAAVAHICRLLDGLPLAIELAASWVRIYDPETIAQEIQRGLDFLVSPLRDVPERHRSLRAVFEHSWRLLPPAEQRALVRSTVFVGSFSLEAALAVTGMGIGELANLLDKSHLRRAAGGRYTVHELLRQFAAEKRASLPSGADDPPVEAAHAAYFLRRVAERQPDYTGPEPHRAWQHLKPDLDDLRAAWQWTVDALRLDLLAPAIEGLASSYQVGGLFKEGEAMFAAAVQRLRGLDGSAAAATPLSHALCEQAEFRIKLGQLDQALADAQEAADLAAAGPGPSSPVRLAQAQVILGRLLELRGEYDRALAHLEPALAFYQAAGDALGEALALNRVGNVHWRRANYPAALDCLERALSLDRAAGNLSGVARHLNNLGIVHKDAGHHEQALACLHEALRIDESLGNTLGVARNANNLGLVYWQTGRLDEALARYTQTLDTARALGHKRGMALAIGNMGIIHHEQGNNAEALNCYRQALELSQALGYKQGVATFMGNMGNIYREQGDFSLAAEHYERALALDREIGNREGIARHLGYTAALLRDQGDVERALALFDEAILILREVGAQYYLAWQLIDKAEILLEQGRLEAAQSLAAEGLQIALAINRHDYVFKGRLLAARLRHAAGDSAAARIALEALLPGSGLAQEAALRYELWRLTGDAAHAAAAHSHYTTLHARTPNREFRDRLQQLTGVHPPILPLSKNDHSG